MSDLDAAARYSVRARRLGEAKQPGQSMEVHAADHTTDIHCRAAEV